MRAGEMPEARKRSRALPGVAAGSVDFHYAIAAWKPPLARRPILSGTGVVGRCVPVAHVKRALRGRKRPYLDGGINCLIFLVF